MILCVKVTDLPKEPRGEEAEEHRVIGLAVKPGHADSTAVPQLALPAVQGPGREAHIDEHYVGAPFNQPAAKVHLQEETGAGCVGIGGMQMAHTRACNFLHHKGSSFF